jgi:hypothetical protein
MHYPIGRMICYLVVDKAIDISGMSSPIDLSAVLFLRKFTRCIFVCPSKESA